MTTNNITDPLDPLSDTVPQPTVNFAVTLPDGRQHVLYTPFPKQLEFHRSTATNLLAIGSRNSGKLLRLTTPIPTPTGMSTMGELKIGDQVIDENGQPCNVVWKSEPHVDSWGTYRLTFDDGTEIVAGGHHEWITMTADERKQESRRTLEYREKRRKWRGSKKRTTRKLEYLPQPSGKLRTTKEIADSVREYRFTGYGRGENNHSIDNAKAWEFSEKVLPVAPYVLGVWLGDGTTINGDITNLDEEIFDEITKAGYVALKRKAQNRTRGIQGFAKQLRALGVLGNKHIPHDYLYAAKEQRLALLQGLMDSDGYCGDDNRVEFCNTNFDLANGVYHLACSLGLKVTLNEGRATLYGKDCGPRYRVGWTGAVPVFRLKRKLEKLKTESTLRTSRRFIAKVERIDDEVMQCIQVDSPNHMYLCSKAGIPTHNSIMLRNDAHMRALASPGKNLILIRKTFPDLMKNHIHAIESEMKLLGGYYNRTQHIAYYPNGCRLFLSHVASGDEGMNLLGAEFLAAYIDEISTIPWEFFLKLMASVRDNTPGYKAVVRAATNPLGESADDLRRYFITKDVPPEENQDYDPREWSYIRINMEDNPHADVETYRKRLSNLSGKLRAAWLEGEFSDDDQLFRLEPQRDGRPYHVINELDTEKVIKAGQIYKAFDWGWHPDPSYCAWIAHLGDRFIVINEKFWHKTNAEDIAADIKAIDRDMGIERTVICYCDPSMDVHHGNVLTTKDVFEQCGIPMECSVNDREYFSRAIHDALGREVGNGIPRIQFYGPGCPQLIKAIPQQRSNPKRPLALGDHDNDHPVVTLAYFLISHSSLDRGTFVQRVLPRWMQPRRSPRTILGSEGVR